MKVYLGADHAGFKLKEEIKEFLSLKDVSFEDLTPEYVEGDDYPLAALKVCEKVIKDKNSKGIVICGTGIGVSIAANKVAGIRAALCYNHEQMSLSRSHNDANVLALSGYFFNHRYFDDIIFWLNTPFEGGRHERRVNQIKDIEKKYFKK
ncbi:MAG: ribose 5-phosphate isomerase B [Nanoarchaeota archaeon]|nr:ribose 5-phosphate isomerase B [Nanoarchaeota archaeon]MBU1270483.1 ribose 5-phosphate isomerase B [Nanoarchaeota archaeon]MBU1603696.1 ribose 5-phosphate isomerase B [Nanoarchaeota archaeon]MBU2443709.1 ribose 5-phosphate isomerase B [Nanoarchaeota archaeon]